MAVIGMENEEQWRTLRQPKTITIFKTETVL